MQKSHFLCSLFLLCFLQSCDTIKSKPLSTEKKQSLPAHLQLLQDSLIVKLKQSGIPGSAVVVVEDTSVTYIKSFGLKENGTNDSLDINSVFRIASLSKAFSALLTGLLVQDGVLNWDDKVVKYYKEFSLKDTTQTQKIEIQHLLSHSSGLPLHAYTNLIEDGLPLDKIIPQLKNVGLISTAGEIYAYQNAAFAVIEPLIEAATGQTFLSLLEQKIFIPAGMKNASAQYDDLYTSSDLARPHRWNSDSADYVAVKLNKKYFNAISAGGINASIYDMSQWLQLILGNRPDIVSAQTLDYIFKAQVNTNTRRLSRRWGVKKSEYALGWRVLTFKDRVINYHGGYVNSYRSEIAIDRENKIGICVLFNASHRITGDIIPDFFRSLEKPENIKNISIVE